jgi:activating signal cointegrator 1
MRALSLTQPWATAMAIGLKEWETRSWPSSFRGQVAIHAAKNFPRWAKEFAEEVRIDHSLLPSVRDMPLGCIVAIGEITECRRTAELRSELSQIEQKWGDYADGRYAFKFNLIRMVVPPVPAKGALGFWAVDDHLWMAIRESLCA